MAGVFFHELIQYTDWQRAEWQAWFERHGDLVLLTGLGVGGDGRFGTVGEAIRHVFSAEHRYIQRLRGMELSDQKAVGAESAGPLFAFGAEGRAELKRFLETWPAEEWDVPREFPILTFQVTASPRKIVTHILLHEIRHWAQIATLLRLEGHKMEFHDFLASPAMGGGFRRID